MITVSDNVINAIKSPVRQIKAKVELYSGSTLLDTFRDSDRLISFTIDRVGEESKFFGFGVFQKINIKLIDIERELNITTADYFKVVYTIAGEEITSNPLFYVTEVHRDENTNELSVTAYDALYEADKHIVDEIPFIKEIKDAEIVPEEEEEIEQVVEENTTYIVEDYLLAASALLELTEAPIINITSEWQNLIYNDIKEVNLEGTETIKELLDDIAEIAGAVYFINHNNALCFVRLGGSALPINKAQYIALESGENRRLTTFTHTTDLADNITVTSTSIGSTQFIRGNVFVELDVDKTTLILNDLLATLGDFTINQFSCTWRGNPVAEVAEKIELTTKDNNTVISYILNDVIEYNGALIEKTSWSYEDNEEETASNPATLGEALKQTFARVDKANKEITLVASKASENEAAIAQIKIDTESIAAGVSSSQTTLDELTGEIDIIKQDVATKITPEAVEIAINSALENGVDSVSTSTGFTFNSEGLNITKTDSEMSTLINEDGMRVSKNDEEVLTADNTGVNAINLTARQFLVIGAYSRFEDFGERTGCFWLGG